MIDGFTVPTVSFESRLMGCCALAACRCHLALGTFNSVDEMIEFALIIPNAKSIDLFCLSPFAVIDQMRQEPELLHLGLWVSTVACISGALLFSFIGALMAVVNTAATPIETLAGRLGLFLWNAFSSETRHHCNLF